MQPQCGLLGLVFLNLSVTLRAIVGPFALFTMLSGCQQHASTLDPVPEQPHRGGQLVIGCSPSLEPTDLIERYSTEWQYQQSVSIQVLHGKWDENKCDIVLATPAELPALVESGRFLAIPETITNRENAYQWDGLLNIYSGTLARWGGAAYGLPLLGEGHVLVYRKTPFDALRLEAPASWEEFLADAALLAKPGKPSLPPLPASALDLETEFHLIACCHDRLGLSQVDVAKVFKDERAGDRVLSYQYQLRTGEPRINAPAFVYALDLLQRLQPFRETKGGNDPVDAFLHGTASLGIVSLRDLHRLQHSPLRGEIRIAPLPGARFTFDPTTGERVPTSGNTINRIPYFGARAWIGLVSKNCSNPELAWDFLASFGNPEKTGSELVAGGKWGAGPFRYLHLEERGRHLWHSFDFSREDTDKLILVLKQQTQTSMANPCCRLRLPNQEAHTMAFDTLVRPALLTPKNDPRRTMNEVAARWTDLWRGVTDEQRKTWVKMCYGSIGSSDVEPE